METSFSSKSSNSSGYGDQQAYLKSINDHQFNEGQNFDSGMTPYPPRNGVSFDCFKAGLGDQRRASKDYGAKPMDLLGHKASELMNDMHFKVRTLLYSNFPAMLRFDVRLWI
jgi:hypothetical protein